MCWTNGVEFPAGATMGFFILATVSRPALGPTQPPVQWILGAPSLRVEQPECEADHSSPVVRRLRMHRATPPHPCTSS